MKLAYRLRFAPAALALLALLFAGASTPLLAQDAPSPISFSVNDGLGEIEVRAGDELQLFTSYASEREAKIFLLVAPVDAPGGLGAPFVIERAALTGPMELLDVVAIPKELPGIKVAMTAVAVQEDGTVHVADPVTVSILSIDGV